MRTSESKNGRPLTESTGIRVPDLGIVFRRTLAVAASGAVLSRLAQFLVRSMPVDL